MVRASGNRRGFTLVELLVVIAIIGVLVALLLPAVQQAREAARRMSCGNNLKQFGLGIQNYADVWKVIPPGFGHDGRSWVGAGPIGWQARILPQMEQGPLFDKINFNVFGVSTDPNTGSTAQVSGYNSFVAGSQGTVVARQVQVPYAKCPSDSSPDNNDWAQGSYSGNLGSQYVPSGNSQCDIWVTKGVHYENYSSDWNEAPYGDGWNERNLSGVFSRTHAQPGTPQQFYRGMVISLAAVRDGTSNTIAVGEILYECHAEQEGWWSYNGASNAHASTSAPINTLTTCATSQQDALNKNYPYPQCFSPQNRNFSWGFKSRHPAGCQFVFVDGSVHFISASVNYTTYQRLGGRADGLVVGEY